MMFMGDKEGIGDGLFEDSHIHVATVLHFSKKKKFVKQISWTFVMHSTVKGIIQ
jgi:hypothetical protein